MYKLPNIFILPVRPDARVPIVWPDNCTFPQTEFVILSVQKRDVEKKTRFTRIFSRTGRRFDQQIVSAELAGFLSVENYGTTNNRGDVRQVFFSVTIAKRTNDLEVCRVFIRFRYFVIRMDCNKNSTVGRRRGTRMHWHTRASERTEATNRT